MVETKELRGDAPADLVRALDALALGEDMSRNAYDDDELSTHEVALTLRFLMKYGKQVRRLT